MQYQPHKKQLEVHGSPKRFKVLNWGRQTGKSILALNYTYYEALRKQGRYWIVLPTYKQAKNVFWKQYIQMIPEGLIEKKDATELSVVFKNNINVTLPDGTKIKHDPSQPPSMIELKGSDDADSLRGAKVHGFVFDEYAFHKPDAWEGVFSPMLSTTSGWAMFISSPDGFNHFYDFAMQAQTKPEWFYSHATFFDNPSVPEKERVSAKKRVSKLKWEQEYMAKFKQKEGLVYDDFDHQVHVVPPQDIPDEGTKIVAIDFGWSNPSAVLFILIDYDQNWYIYDEFYKTKTTINDLIPILKDKTSGSHIAHWIGDSAQAEHIANMNAQGIPVHAIKKRADSIQKGIELISDKLKPREQLSGPPKPKLYISSVCKNVIFEMSSYHYPEKTNRNMRESPVKEQDHAMDALRYANLYMKFDTQRSYNIPQDDLFKDGWY